MKIGTTRMETFSDGVIAIIITIMVLELKLPEREENTEYELLGHMRHLLPYFVAYIFSFFMIGVFWTNHHHMFHLLEHTDERLLWQNLFFLFSMSLIPYATGLIGNAPLLPGAVAFYGIVMLFTTTGIAMMRAHTVKGELVHHDEDQKLEKKIRFTTVRGKMKSYIGAAAYLLSIPLAFVNVFLSYVLFAIPPIIFFIPDGVDDEALANKIEEKNG